MSFDIFFNEDVARTLLALSQANARAMILAKRYGADDRFIAIAEAAYQAALDDIAAAFGLSPAIVDGDGNKLLPAWHIVEKKRVEYYE